MPFLLFSAIAGRSSLEDVKLVKTPESESNFFNLNQERYAAYAKGV